MINKDIRHQLKHFFCQFRSFHGTYIPEQRNTELAELLRHSANISIMLDKENPLSVMETMMMVVCVLNISDDDIADIFCLRRNTVHSYIESVKDKLNATTRMEAVMTSLRIGIIKIIY